MRLLSVNVGLPREVAVGGQVVRTSIWKQPVAGRVRVAGNNLDGDRQSDLTVHGGEDKAVYAYPSEHYAYWRERLPGVELPWGAFGENFSLEGLTEDQARIGHRLRIGSTEFAVTQPRLPCYKLALRFGRPAMEKAFLQSRRTGFYLRVVREGDVGELGPEPAESLTILEVVDLFTSPDADPVLLRRAVDLPGLSAAWRSRFRRRLAVFGG